MKRLCLLLVVFLWPSSVTSSDLIFLPYLLHEFTDPARREFVEEVVECIESKYKRTNERPPLLAHDIVFVPIPICVSLYGCSALHEYGVLIQFVNAHVNADHLADVQDTVEHEMSHLVVYSRFPDETHGHDDVFIRVFEQVKKMKCGPYTIPVET